MSFSIVQPEELPWEERPSIGDGPVRHAADLTAAAGLEQSRARLWRLPPGARGRRHSEGAQEEVFLVVEGTLTILLGDPPERFDVRQGGVVAVRPGTPLQLRNESTGDLTLLAYGAPPVAGGASYFDDVELT